jgi:hypothetical protein
MIIQLVIVVMFDHQGKEIAGDLLANGFAVTPWISDGRLIAVRQKDDVCNTAAMRAEKRGDDFGALVKSISKILKRHRFYAAFALTPDNQRSHLISGTIRLELCQDHEDCRANSKLARECWLRAQETKTEQPA